MIKYQELVKVTMPPEKKTSASKCIVGHYFVRPISNVITIPLLDMGVSAVTVTKISCFFSIIAMLFFLTPINLLGFWGGWICIFIWNILDGIDGNIARFTSTCSKEGELWDATVGWIALVSFYVGMGFVTFYNLDSEIFHLPVSDFLYIFMGCISALSWIFPRLVMQKKSVLMGEETVSMVKQRSDYGIIKLLLFNLSSINGLASVLFLAAYIFNILTVCMICYCVLSIIVAIGSLYSLLQ